MKTKFILLFVLALPLFVSAQKFTLKGVLADTSGAALESGTVMLLNPADSSLISFARSQAGGSFEFKNLTPGHYLLRGSYLGFRNMQRPVHLDGAAGSTVVDLGVLRLETAYNLLGEVQIKAEANPVTIKKDTIEYNAGSFKVKENAVVEDLLKKMPGIEVKQDGTVKAQGEEVKNVLVDGKKFFGTDPKVATKNLPADAVDKVQVYDQKSEQATFSGVDDGVREKTINLDLKEDKKDGWFGRATLGGGSSNPDLRYAGRANLNRFKPKQQLSFLGLGNNINEAGFTLDEYMAYSGAMRQMMGGGGSLRLEFNSDDMSIPLDFGDNQGFLGTWAGGINFNQEYGAKHKGDLNTSYMYSRADKTFDRAINRQSLLPESAYNTLQNAHQNTLRDNHRLSLTLDQKLDSTNSIQLSSNLVYSETANTGNSGSSSRSESGILQNDGIRKGYSNATGMNWTASLLWRHKFAKKGRNFSITLNSGLNNNRSSSNNFSDNGFYDPSGQLRFRDTINQDQNFKNDVVSLSGRANYVEPLGKRRYLEFSYQYSQADNQADKQVYDLSAGERNFNALLSNAYKSRYDYHRGGAGFRINRKDWNGSVGLDAQYAVLDGAITSGQGQPVRQSYTNYLPRLDFNYDFSRSKHLSFNYRTNINAPSIQQLQPVPDFSDPLNIVEGNPDLNPEYMHDLQGNFFQFNPTSMRSLFGNAAFTYTTDKIVNAQYVDSLFVRRYKPVNVASDYRAFATVGAGLPIKKLKSRINISTEGSANRGINYINDVENSTTGLNIRQIVNWEFEPADWFVLYAGAELGWTKTSYSIDKAFNQDYFTQTYTAELTAELPKNFSAGSNLRVVTNTGLSNGYDQTIPIWTASISKFLMKNKRIELTFEVHDILNRNVGINRSANLNYIEDERVSSLGRYFMLRCTYALNSMAGGHGGPGMRIMIRR